MGWDKLDVNAPANQPKWVPSDHDYEADLILGRGSKITDVV